MTIATYAQLQSAISAWLLRESTDLVVTAGKVQEYITLCETELNRELKVRELEEDAAVVTVASTAYAALPTDFARVSDFYHDDAPYEINWIPTKGEIKRKWGTASGRPTDYTIWGANLYFGKLPDAVYNLTLDYYKTITPLSDSATTNEIFPKYADLYLYGSLRQACMHIKNQAFGEMVGTNYAGIIERIKDANIASKLASTARAVTRKRLA